MNKIRENRNVFNDNIAYIEEYDPGLSNRSHQDRLTVITTIASICYDKPDVIGKQSLYDRLSMEGAGIPSSSFEFIPVLLRAKEMAEVMDIAVQNHTTKVPDVLTFGEVIEGTVGGRNVIVLTNLRALLQDLGWQEDFTKAQELSEKYFNTSEEDIALIRKHYRVYKVNIDIATSKQWVRHNYNLQELSRRYVSGKKLPFEFYIDTKMRNTTTTVGGSDISCGVTVSTADVIDICMNHYYAALEQGVPPQDARRIIPQGAYTTIWTGMTPRVYTNMLKLRTKASTQWEFRQVANQIASWDGWEDVQNEPTNQTTKGDK
jgi:thymidylate synthase (FAD)